MIYTCSLAVVPVRGHSSALAVSLWPPLRQQQQQRRRWQLPVLPFSSSAPPQSPSWGEAGRSLPALGETTHGTGVTDQDVSLEIVSYQLGTYNLAIKSHNKIIQEQKSENCLGPPTQQTKTVIKSLKNKKRENNLFLFALLLQLPTSKC